MANHGGTMLDAAQAHALALGMYNAVNAQQQAAVVRQTATTMVCAAMLSLGVAESVESAPSTPAPDDAAPPSAPPAPPAAPAAPEVAAALAKVAPSALDTAVFAGKAYQSVAQSTALAVQDAADYLRNVSTIAATAAGVAMTQYLADPGSSDAFDAAMAASQRMMAAAVANFEAIGASAEQLLKDFPGG